MIYSPDEVLLSRQCSILIPEDITGGPDRNNGALVSELAAYREKALVRVESAIARVEKSKGKVAVNKIFFDAIHVESSRAFMLVKITFNLRAPKMRLCVVAGTDKQ